MFRSLKSGEKHVSLTKYIQNMVEGQESIFYMSGLSPEVLQKSAHIQKLNKKNYEVLFLTDASDEPCLTRISEFEGKKLVSIQKEKIELGETVEDKKRHQRLKDFYNPLTKWWEERIRKETESGELKSVKISTRLVDASVVLVTSQFGSSAFQEKLMRAQSLGREQDMSRMYTGKKILEINPDHPAIKADENDRTVAETADLLFQTAAIESGFEFDDATYFVRSVYRLMSTALNVDPNAEIREVELPEEEEMKEEEVDMDEKKDAKEEKEEKKDKYDEIVFSTRKTRKFEVKINQVFFFFRF